MNRKILILLFLPLILMVIRSGLWAKGFSVEAGEKSVYYSDSDDSYWYHKPFAAIGYETDPARVSAGYMHILDYRIFDDNLNEEKIQISRPFAALKLKPFSGAGIGVRGAYLAGEEDYSGYEVFGDCSWDTDAISLYAEGGVRNSKYTLNGLDFETQQYSGYVEAGYYFIPEFGIFGGYSYDKFKFVHYDSSVDLQSGRVGVNIALGGVVYLTGAANVESGSDDYSSYGGDAGVTVYAGEYVILSAKYQYARHSVNNDLLEGTEHYSTHTAIVGATVRVQ
jgi:hypothetical protein